MPDGIAAVGAPGAVPGQHGGTESALHALSGIGSDGFLRLLVAQLRYQSPLEPADPGDMMLQTAQLAQLDATQQLLSLHQRDFGLQQAVMAAGMVGSQVTATDSEGLHLQGVVDAVRYTATGPVLEVNGREVALGSVTEVRRVDGASAPAPSDAPATPPSQTAPPPETAPPADTGADGTGSDDGTEPVTAAPDADTVEPDPQLDDADTAAGVTTEPQPEGDPTA